MLNLNNPIHKMINLVLMLSWVFVGQAFSGYSSFNNNGGDRLWSNPANWSGAAVPEYKGPGLGDAVIHTLAGTNLVVDSTTPNGNAEDIGLGWNGLCEMEMSGGSLQAYNEFIVGQSSDAQLNMSGGTITSSSFRMGHSGSGTVTMTGTLTGTLVNTVDLHVGTFGAGQSGLLNIHGGVLNASNVLMNEHGPTTSSIDLRNGKGAAQLVIDDNLVTHATYGDRIAEWIGLGYLTAYDGAGVVEYDYDVTRPGKTTVWGTPPPPPIVTDCWNVVELSFVSSNTYSKPWSNVNLVATFTGPSNLQYQISGFWDGGQNWKVRFAPTVPGAWSYQTVCAEDAGLNGHTNAIIVNPATGDNPLYQHGGFLKNSSNGRYLTYSDGTPFFWLGDTWWYAVSDYMSFDGATWNPTIASSFQHCVDKRESQGYTIAHFGFLGERNGYKNPLNFNQDPQIHPEYWREVDHCIEYAIDHGIMPQIAMLWVQAMDNTMDDWQTIWKYFIARYGAYPITWDFSTEYNPTYQDLTTIVPFIKQLGQFIKDNDPYGRAMSVMPWWYQGDAYQVWGEPWHDFIQLNGSHEDPYAAPISEYQHAYNSSQNSSQPTSPIIVVETTFEGIEKNGNPPHDDSVVRRNFYRAMQLGSAGFTYGAHGLWYPTQHATDQTFWADWGPSVPWWEAVELPGGAQMGYLKTFYQSLPWWELEPQPDAITPILAENQRILPTFSPEDRVIVVYFPKDNSPTLSVSLQLSTSKNTDYRASWFNPRTATYSHLPVLSVAGTTISLPDRNDNKDWILLLQEMAPMGTPEWWLASHGLTNGTPAQEELLDGDSDGVLAWEEWVSDTDPTEGASVLQIMNVVDVGSGMRVDWKGGVQAVQYLEWSTNLVSGSAWMPIFTNQPPTSTSANFTDVEGANAGSGFYRIKAQR